MTNTHRERLNGWGVVKVDWEQFRKKVREKWGAADPYLNRELEDAAREFLDKDEFAPLEKHARRIAEATGRSCKRGQEKNTPTHLSDPPRTRVWRSLHPVLKEELEAFAQKNDLPKWEVLTAVIREYNYGGRADRLRNWLSQEVVNEVESRLADINTGTTNGLSKSERLEIAIAQHLGEQFSEADLADAIDTETTGSDYYHDRYPPQVIERKGVKRWKKQDEPDVFLQPEIWAEKQATEIINQLRIDASHPTTPFSREEFARAADATGVEVSEENQDNLNDYRYRVCDRLDYKWDDKSKAFVPSSSDNSGSDNMPAGEASGPKITSEGTTNDIGENDRKTDVIEEMDSVVTERSLTDAGSGE